MFIQLGKALVYNYNDPRWTLAYTFSLDTPFKSAEQKFLSWKVTKLKTYKFFYEIFQNYTCIDFS